MPENASAYIDHSDRLPPQCCPYGIILHDSTLVHSIRMYSCLLDPKQHLPIAFHIILSSSHHTIFSYAYLRSDPSILTPCPTRRPDSSRSIECILCKRPRKRFLGANLLRADERVNSNCNGAVDVLCRAVLRQTHFAEGF